MTVTPGLTPVQRITWEAIRDLTARNGVSPSYHEIAAAIGLRVKSAAHRTVQQLVQRGYIIRHPYRARSIVAVDPENSQFRGASASTRKQIANLRAQLKRYRGCTDEDIRAMEAITDKIDTLLYNLEKWGCG